VNGADSGRGGGRYGSGMTTNAGVERQKLADLMAEVGPDADTLCEGWTTRDLAAHIVMRERRPDGAVGVLVKPFAGYADKVQDSIAAKDWGFIVAKIRSGPPKWSPMRLDRIDRVTNTIEFFVHHEDVRRAVDGWQPRELDAGLVGDLYADVKRGSKLLVRKAPTGVTLEPTDGHDAVVAKTGDPMVTVRGPVGELVLFVYGRQAHALVELDGSPDAVESLRTARFGL
jgi:uncharacterized protein (TIGR03085 family)